MKCRALIDTSCRRSYITKAIFDLFPIKKEHKAIETLTNSTTKKLEVYSEKVQDWKNELSSLQK